MSSGRLILLCWFVAATWREQRGRWLVATASVAIGIALATAIHTVNQSALDSFQQAIDTVNGEAQLQVVARTGHFDERMFDRVLANALAAGVAAASPVVAVEVRVETRPEDSAEGKQARRDQRLTVLGLDVFRAATATPGLLPIVDGTQAAGGSGSVLFGDDTVFLSAAAQAWFGVRPGQTIALRLGLDLVRLRVAGGVTAPAGQRLALMDIGSAQWRLGMLGRLSRIDLKLAEGVTPTQAAAALRAVLPPEVEILPPLVRQQRMSNLSRAYRVNLNVLALVALFTGAFLVFSAVGLSVVRQRPQLALLSVLGASRRWVQAAVLAQGLLVAAAGSIAGVALGLLLAQGLLALFGGDLGGGYFSGTPPPLRIDGVALTAFALLGLLIGAFASLLPALEAVSARPVAAMRSGSTEESLSGLARRWPAMVLAALGVALAGAPAVDGLPLPAYAAIACLLLAAIAAVPWLCAILFPVLPRLFGQRLSRHPVAWLALQRAAQAPAQAASVIAGVVASFALTVAMVIMVASFRSSVADWLDVVLPADLYGRTASAGASAALDAAMQARIRAIPGVKRAEFVRSVDLSLDAAHPPVVLLARAIDASVPQLRLPMTGDTRATPAGGTPIYVSEAMIDLYGFAPGGRVTLPLGTDGRMREFFVAGAYRDYARQHGSIAIGDHDYRRITGDASVSDIALWLLPGVTPLTLVADLARLEPRLGAVEFRSASDLRALSLTIFDRSFAMTYLLEAAALVVALFGVASAYAGQALARAREFAVLRHLGYARSEIIGQVAIEGALLSGFGALLGGAAGYVISLLLIHRVNPQSFHWTMQTHVPLPELIASAVLLAACGAVAAALAMRSATVDGPLVAMRDDS